MTDDREEHGSLQISHRQDHRYHFTKKLPPAGGDEGKLVAITHQFARPTPGRNRERQATRKTDKPASAAGQSNELSDNSENPAEQDRYGRLKVERLIGHTERGNQRTRCWFSRSEWTSRTGRCRGSICTEAINFVTERAVKGHGLISLVTTLIEGGSPFNKLSPSHERDPCGAKKVQSRQRAFLYCVQGRDSVYKGFKKRGGKHPRKMKKTRSAESRKSQ